MGIYRETKEEMLARQIEYAPKKQQDVVISQQQKELDFDEQLLSVLASDQVALHDAIVTCSQHLVDKSEAAITSSADPSHVDQLLRISFWEEVTSALQENRPFSERSVYNGVCSYHYWVKLRDENPDKFTYILIPVKQYSRVNKLLLALGQQALIEILNADPFIKGQGSGHRKRLDPKIAAIQLKAYEMVENRIYGKAVNRLQTHNINESSPDAQETIEQLKREIIELENKGVITLDGEDIE